MLARILRAITLSQGHGGTVESFLDIADFRTLRQLFDLAGIEGQQVEVWRVLERQRLIRNSVALCELEKALRSSFPGA